MQNKKTKLKDLIISKTKYDYGVNTKLKNGFTLSSMRMPAGEIEYQITCDLAGFGEIIEECGYDYYQLMEEYGRNKHTEICPITNHYKKDGNTLITNEELNKGSL